MRSGPASTQIAAIVVLLITLSGAWASPVVSERDPLEPFRFEAMALDLIIEYFTASKNGDVAHVITLIDYEEWAKEMGLGGEQAKEWEKAHEEALAISYRDHKAAGSTKEFQVVKQTVEGRRATFEVAQARVDGTYLWEIRLLYKNGRWVIAGYRLLDISNAAQ